METNDETDVNSSLEELIQLFDGVKEVFKQEVEQKENLRQKLDFIENNSEWSKRNVHRLTQELTQSKTIISSQQKSLDQIKHIKEMNKQLNEEILALTAKEKTNEELNQEVVDKLKSQMNTEIEELNKSLNEKELTISSKDILLSQTKREITDIKTKYDENIEEIKEFYENKIQSLYKEFDDKYLKTQKQNDEKIIEIRAKCMRSVDKTKEEFQTKLCKSEIANNELKEQLNHLRLEFEAMKMTHKFENTKNTKNSKTSSKSKSGNQSSSETKSKLSILVLESDEEIESPIKQSVSKRKKFVQNSDPYLDYVRDD